MEDEARPLPKGWVRTFDPESGHQFFVNITKDPPRSIWVHPYDDDEYLGTLSSEQRERIEEESMRHGQPSHADIMAEHTDEEASGASDGELPPRPDGKGKGKDGRTFGRKVKDKLTGSTHEQRETERKRRAEEEQRMYERHMKYRQAMAKAMQTGERQLLGKDHNGKDVYVEPPRQQVGYGYSGGGLLGSGYSGGGYGYNPYGPSMYSTPQTMYARPSMPYGRPVGRGYGGGYGLPLAVGGGLLGGMLLGDAMMGGF